MPIINGERYICMFDRSRDGIHMASGDRNIMLSVMMLEDIIAAMYDIVPDASTPCIT